MPKIKVAGLDGAKANFGIAKMIYDTDTGELNIVSIRLVETQALKGKHVRVSSDNLRRAREIADVLKEELKDCAMAFGEVPTGGQSADAVLSFGIVIGLYASLAIPMVEVSPSETKKAAVGTSTASKEEIIEWAMEKYPDAAWFTKKRKGVISPTAKNEHVADAAAIVHAGVKTQEFRVHAALFKSLGNSTAA